MMPENGASEIEWSVPGLQAPAEIIVDRWGIPHIYARTKLDVFFVQGFNAARDRLWQLDIWRKRGVGQLAADFGPGFLAQDRAARLFLYRGDWGMEWQAYAPADARAITEAFVAGLNAFIALTEQKSDLLPVEFAAMGVRPACWEAADVVRIRSHAVIRNVASEVLRAKVATAEGVEIDRLRIPIEPPWTPMIPDPLVLEDYPADLLDVYRLATAAVTFTPERLAATLDHAERWAKVNDAGQVYSTLDGSNNWAISPERTATGRPILANDPHRIFSLPSLRYVTHLSGPGINVIGAGEPAVPGVSIGHNEKVGFGLTSFPIDQEDLYIHVTDPADPDRYRYKGGWEAMRVVTERVMVKGAPDQQLTLKFTRHGPVIYQDRARHRAYAVRSVWFEPGASAYLGSLAYLAAGTLDEFAGALRYWSVPAVNQVCADIDGNIGRFAVAKAPRRLGWDGLLPVPGDGRFEWSGFHPFEDLPRVVNPTTGFVYSANEMSLPADYPYWDRRLGFEWEDAFRADRVRTILGEQSRHTLARSRSLQNDEFSGVAERVCRHLRHLPQNASASSALLLDWDFRMSRDSQAAALFEVWWVMHLKPALLRRASQAPRLEALLAPGSDAALIGVLDRIGDKSACALGDILNETLVAAATTCETLLGPAQEGWRWGALHRIRFTHPLRTAAEETPGLRDLGPLPMGGSGATVMAARSSPSSFDVDLGASFKMVLDVGDWDRSVAINAPGQSGDGRSEHYNDLASIWNRHDYVPLLYTREAIERAAELRIRLIPGCPGDSSNL
jgi:penicillin amidase